MLHGGGGGGQKPYVNKINQKKGLHFAKMYINKDNTFCRNFYVEGNLQCGTQNVSFIICYYAFLLWGMYYIILCKEKQSTFENCSISNRFMT